MLKYDRASDDNDDDESDVCVCVVALFCFVNFNCSVRATLASNAFIFSRSLRTTDVHSIFCVQHSQ